MTQKQPENTPPKKRARVNLYIDPELHGKLVALAKTNHRSRSAEIVVAIEQYVVNIRS